MFIASFYVKISNIHATEGKPRQKRKYVEYKNACLPNMENKLLFILIYIKDNELQQSLAEIFEISQSKANRWIHLLHEVLNQSLEELEMLPARNAESLEHTLSLDEETVITSNTNTEVNMIEAESDTGDMMTEPDDLIEIDLYLHDGTERAINRPLKQALQKIFYSGKPKRHTVKNILFTTIDGYILFLSETCEGKKHDSR